MQPFEQKLDRKDLFTPELTHNLKGQTHML